MLIFSWNYAFRIAEKIAELCYFYAKSYHIMPHYAHIYAANVYDGSVQNNRGIFCIGRCTVVAKVQRGQRTVRPTIVATTVTDCSGLDMLSRES